MTEGAFDAFRPIKHPMGFEYKPAVPQQPTASEQIEIAYRDVARMQKSLGKRSLQVPSEEPDEYHNGVVSDEDEFYIRFRDDN